MAWSCSGTARSCTLRPSACGCRAAPRGYRRSGVRGAQGRVRRRAGRRPARHATGPRRGARARDWRRTDAAVAPGECPEASSRSCARSTWTCSTAAGLSTRPRDTPDGAWRICYDNRGLNAIARPAVGPLPHMDALLAARVGRASSPISITQVVISCWCGPRTGGKRASGRSWASSSGQGAFRSAGRLLAADARHEPGSDRRPRFFCGSYHAAGGCCGVDRHTDPWRGPLGVWPPGLVRARVYGRLSGALADAGAAPARCRGGARELPPPAALRQELQVRVLAAGARLPRTLPLGRGRARCSRLSSWRRRLRAPRCGASRGWPTATAAS
jgi:hypothetical protein